MTDDEIRELGRLARIRLDDADIGALRDQLARIVGYIDRLADVDVDGVPPFLGPRHEPVRLREDDPADPMAPADALRSAPRHDGASVLVPRFVDEG